MLHQLQDILKMSGGAHRITSGRTVVLSNLIEAEAHLSEWHIPLQVESLCALGLPQTIDWKTPPEAKALVRELLQALVASDAIHALREEITMKSGLYNVDLRWALRIVSEPVPGIAVYVSTPGQLGKLTLEETLTVFL